MRKIYQLIKRILDFIIAIILLIILLPLLLIISIIIKLTSKGPIIYKQLRTGKNGKNFYIYKFRSMQYSNNNLEDENKITKFGSFLRKTSLDELPQLINIIKGEMSFIGPRPWITDYYNNFTNEQKKRVSVTPGITGLAQVSGRNKISVLKKIDYDLYYIDNYSLLLDLKILLLTITLVFKNNNNITKKEINKEINELKKNKEKKH